MFALCVESSHARGMGHFYRTLLLREALQRAGQQSLIVINEHEPALRLLRAAAIAPVVADLSDLQGDWESELIARHRIRTWVNDRLDTDAAHAQKVKRHGIRLMTLDDRGSGAAAADLNIAALAFASDEVLPGKRVLRGVDYLILNPGIAAHRRVRQTAGRLLVTLGGSDTHGVTVKVVQCLRSAGRTATLILGPGFRHDEALARVIGPGFEIKRSVPSLIAEFAQHDLAITGGGITPFEANASGLPCIVVANETFEIPVAQELVRLGGSVFAGHHAAIDEQVLLRDLPLAQMSEAGMAHIDLEGAARVVAELVAP